MRQKRTSQGFPIFPKTLCEFQRRFATEEACIAYLINIRWPVGFECPFCQCGKAWRLSLRSFRCQGCRKEIYVTAGTVIHRSHIPLQYWFWAAYLMSTLTPGISALQIQHQLGIGSYETALYLCRRLRRAMVNPAREPLNGVVEADEFYVGGPKKGRRGRGSEGKVTVAAAVENRGDHTGRIRLQIIPDASSKSLHSFVRNNVACGSQVNTDDWGGYMGLEACGYNHQPRVEGFPGNAAKILPWVHKVIGNLKTWLRGTHHGVDPEHLQEYLDEFTFRYNRRHYRESAFLTLLVLVTKLKPLRLNSKKLVASSG